MLSSFLNLSLEMPVRVMIIKKHACDVLHDLVPFVQF